MFLLVSVRHVEAHPGEHQHGISIQISIRLGKTFLWISRIRNIPLTWILARVFVYVPPFISQILDFINWTVFVYVPPFISQILDFINWTVLIFILIYFEWRDTKSQQLFLLAFDWLRPAFLFFLNWTVCLFVKESPIWNYPVNQ